MHPVIDPAANAVPHRAHVAPRRPDCLRHAGLATGVPAPAPCLRAAPSRSRVETVVVLSLLLLSGCDRAPAYSILGSFFPVWLFCGIAGIIFAFVVHLVLVRFELDHQLAPPLLVYPALATLMTLSLWLVFFS